jgi:prophage tail gpP-like protein
VRVQYDDAAHDVSVAGRDKAADLWDCAASVDGPFEFSGLSLLEIAQRLASPYGVEVRAEASVGAAFPRFGIQPGETAWDAIERGARQRAVLPVADGLGGLLLTRAGTSRAAGSIELGRNTLKSDASFSHRDRFSKTVALGQAERGQDDDHFGPRGTATDPEIKRYRPKVITGETQGTGVTLQQRAEWEQRVATGRSRRVTYSLAGWQDDGGCAVAAEQPGDRHRPMAGPQPGHADRRRAVRPWTRVRAAPPNSSWPCRTPMR